MGTQKVRKAVGLALAALGWGLISIVAATHMAYAQVPPTDVSVDEAHAFTDVIQTGDLLVYIRFNLPTDQWRQAAYVGDTTCTDAFDWEDDCYTTIISGAALHTLYNGVRGTDPLVGIRGIPRIGYGVSALYLEPGHGITDGASIETCVEGSTTISPQPVSCDTVHWHISGSIAATQTELGTHVADTTSNLEDVLAAPRASLVDNGRVTEAGIPFWREATPAFLQITPQAFVIGVDSIFSDITFATPGPSALDTTLLSDAQSSRVYLGVAALSAEYFGITSQFIGTVLTLIMMGLLMIAVLTKTGSFPFAAISLLVPGGLGFSMVWIDPGWVMAIIMVVVTGGLAWLVRRLPV